MNTEKKRAILINFAYYGLLLVLVAAGVKYLLPMLAPFVLAFLIVWGLRRPTRVLAKRLPEKAAAMAAVLLFYSTVGLLAALLGVKAFSAVCHFVGDLPVFYENRIEPFFMGLLFRFEVALREMDPVLVADLERLGQSLVQSAGEMVSGLSVSAMGAASSVAAGLPGLFIKLVVMVISTFFLAVDYETITSFLLGCLGEKQRDLVLEMKSYVVGTLFVCIRSYLIIMSVTFLELSVGFHLMGLGGAFVLALVISVFDILPVLGTGGIMIPWACLAALQGSYTLALQLLAIYIVVTVVRNILEPKIVGKQIGLHPVATLVCMFVGVQLFGVIGLFGFPIGLSLLRDLHKKGTISLFKAPSS